MALFTIHCTTCQARLRVKDASAIGQILDCPKCGSLLQVTAPPEWQPGAAALAGGVATAASDGSAGSASGEHELNLSQATAANHPADAPGPAPAADRWSLLRPRMARSLRRSLPPLADGETNTEEAPLPVQPAWPLPFVAISAAAVFVLGVGLWLWLATGRRSDVAAAPPAADATAPTWDAGDGSAPSGVPAASGDSSAAETPAATVGDEDMQIPEAVSGELADDEPESAASDETPSVGSDESATAQEESTVSESPTGAELLGQSQEPAPAADEPDGAGADEPAPRALDAPDSDTRLRIEARLADKLPKLEFNNVPLVDFVQFLADFSTLSIKLDDGAIRQAGKTGEVRVRLRLTDTTVEAALLAALKPHGLVHEVRAGGLVVTAAAK